jgi:hypothetical protein
VIEFITRRGYAVAISPCRVILTRKNRPDVTWDYPSIQAAYKAIGGPANHIQYTGGKG